MGIGINHSGTTKASGNSFLKCELYTQGITGAATQLRTRDMYHMEPLGDDSLPVPNRSITHENQSEKYAQLGCAAWEEILLGTIGSRTPSSNEVIVIIDFHPRTCDIARAVARKRGSWSSPAYYFGITDPDRTDLVEAEWAEELSDAAQKPFATTTTSTTTTTLPPLLLVSVLLL